MSRRPTAPRATRTRSTPPTSSPTPSSLIDGEEVDASAITPAFLQDTLQEAEGNEANVATGYHAIEFLLWGQDLNGTGPGAGARPATDFDTANCTGGNCDRRGQYLAAASDLLVSDLEEMVAAWSEGGAARTELATLGVPAILTGMGSLSFGEVAGERMKLGLLLHDPEEEHDCFSDNTHISHLYDAVGRAQRLSRHLPPRSTASRRRGPVGCRPRRAPRIRRSTRRSRACSTTTVAQDGGDGDARRDASRPMTR